MNRKLKAFWPALAVVLAMGASYAAPTAAQTQGVLTTASGQEVTLIAKEPAQVETEEHEEETTEEQKTAIEKEETGTSEEQKTEAEAEITETEIASHVGENAWTMFGIKVECHGSIYTGHGVGSTPHVLIPAGATEVTVTPHYNTPNCDFAQGETKFPMTIDMNGCDYVLTIGETTGGVSTYGITTHVSCPPNKFIQWTIFTSSAHSLKFCTFTFKSTTPTSTAHITTRASDDLALQGTFEELHIEKSGLCGAGTTKEAVFHIDVIVEGLDAVGNPEGITVTDQS